MQPTEDENLSLPQLIHALMLAIISYIETLIVDDARAGHINSSNLSNLRQSLRELREAVAIFAQANDASAAPAAMSPAPHPSYSPGLEADLRRYIIVTVTAAQGASTPHFHYLATAPPPARPDTPQPTSSNPRPPHARTPQVSAPHPHAPRASRPTKHPATKAE